MVLGLPRIRTGWEQICKASMIPWAIALAAALALVACGGSVDATAVPAAAANSAAAGGPGEAKLNRIAYISPEGQLFTISPDGSSPVQLTGAVRADSGSVSGMLAQPLDLSEYYAWPTWSPDGTKLAASRVVVRNNEATVSVEVVDLATSRTTTAYLNEVPSLVADGTPHYLYWSPDSRSLAILSSTPQGLTLFVWDSESGNRPASMEIGAPLYFSWAGDSRAMLLHTGPEVKLSQESGGQPRVVIASDALGFRAPAFSPDGLQIAYVANTGSGGGLFVAPSSNPVAARLVVEVGLMTAFLWSPDGSQLAVAQETDTRTQLFRRLDVVAVNGGDTITVAEEPMIAFYWSPTGGKLAWVAVDAQKREMEWVVGDTAGTAPQRLFRFRPSSATFTMLTYFDQYALSHSPWSPDGTALVVAGSQDETQSGRNGSTPTGDHVFVIDAVSSDVPKDIAAGTLAFWSWN